MSNQRRSDGRVLLLGKAAGNSTVSELWFP